MLSPANQYKFHGSVKITNPRGEGHIHKIHTSEDLCETKMPEDPMKQTQFQGFVGKKFAGILQANVPYGHVW